MATENSPTITIKHIVDAMASPPPAPRLPALPQSVILSLPPGLPLPTSEFSTYRPRIPWKPTCSHIVMSRFYAKGATCDHCKQRPEQGWLYRCVQDREAILRQQMEDGKQVAYDEIGAMLLTQVKPAHRGPEERSDKYSFLRKELTAETMKNYSPDQIATILQQREHANQVAQVQLRETRLKGCRVPVTQLAEILAREDNQRPWTPRESEECKLKVCQMCRPMMEARSYLSLDGIAKGDIPAHAAIGWGFGFFKHRPICSPRVISNWGNRPVPLPRQGIPRASSMPLSLASSSHWSVMDIIEEHLRNSYCHDEDEEDEMEGSTTPEQSEQLSMKRYSGHLPASPIRVSENGSVGLHTGGNEALNSQDLLIRPPWTPPPSPSLVAQAAGQNELPVVGLASGEMICDGRSDASLKTNPRIRFEVLSSLLPPSTDTWEVSHDASPEHHVMRQHGHPILYEPEEACDVGLTLPFNEEVYDTACATPLPERDKKEDLFFLDGKTAMEEFEEDEGVFTAAPLDVLYGVAVTEEAVGFGMADVVTQV